MTRKHAMRGTIGLVILTLAVGAFVAFRVGDAPANAPADEEIVRKGDALAMPAAANTAIALTGERTEDDHPALAKGPDGSIWLTYFEYTPGQPIEMSEVREGNYDSLVPEGNGDRLWLRRFDGTRWEPAIAVTDGKKDIWRPTVAVDGKGNVVVAWAQKVDDDWEILSRTYAPPQNAGEDGAWSKIRNVSKNKGSDFHVVSTTDAKGNVWLVWQKWDDGYFKIGIDQPQASAIGGKLTGLGTSETNNWSPSIAADSKGKIYFATDVYTNGTYNIQLVERGADGWTLHPIGWSPRFEARPHIVCDDKGRVWIAFEQGDEQWGKDYQGDTPEKVGIENLGYGLYINRTIRVLCWDDGKLFEPQADLQQAMAEATPRARSVPRLAFDKQGGLWLFYRHHIKPRGNGEAWQSYALRYDGKSWSKPQAVPESSYIIDDRPGLVPHGEGVLAVYSTDTRTNTRNRKQNDVMAAVIAAENSDKAQEAELKPYSPPAERTVKPVHPNEAENVARIREYRVEQGGRKLKLLRGEFHRHTEYTSHRDQDGLLEDGLRYALDAGRLDWMGNGDHDNGFGHEFLWWRIQKQFDLVHNPPHFVAAMTYERSVRYPSGHRNVMMPRRGIRPLPRLSGEKMLYGTAEEGAPDIALLYKYLKHFGAICSSHTSGTNMGTDWRNNDPAVEPVVEIYQAHRHNYEHFGAPRAPTATTQIGGYQPDGFVWNALEKGYRLGFQSSSDHVGTHMSYGVALTDDASRQGIIDAFKQRHSYAATDNIILVVRSGEHLMGDEFTTGERPTLDVKVLGTAPIAKVHLIRDNKYVYAFSKDPMPSEAAFEYTDADAKTGETHYYYVRVEQEDGNLAWASPMWITYKP